MFARKVVKQLYYLWIDCGKWKGWLKVGQKGQKKQQPKNERQTHRIAFVEGAAHTIYYRLSIHYLKLFFPCRVRRCWSRSHLTLGKQKGASRMSWHCPFCLRAKSFLFNQKYNRQKTSLPSFLPKQKRNLLSLFKAQIYLSTNSFGIVGRLQYMYISIYM